MRHPVLALCLGVLTTIMAQAAQGQAAALAGTWKLNVEKSDRSGDRMRSASSDAPAITEELRDRSRAGGGSGRGGGGAGRGGGAGGGAGGSGGAEGARPTGGESGGARSGGGFGMSPLLMYMRALPELVVVQRDSTITISDPSGQPRTYHPDGRKETEPLLNEETLEITAKWKDAKLTIERKLGSLGSIRETYSIDPASKQLIVEVKVSGGQLPRPVDLHRVYDPATGGQ